MKTRASEVQEIRTTSCASLFGSDVIAAGGG